MEKSSEEKPKKRYSNIIRIITIFGIIGLLIGFFLTQSTNPFIIDESKMNSTDLENPPIVPNDQQPNPSSLPTPSPEPTLEPTQEPKPAPTPTPQKPADNPFTTPSGTLPRNQGIVSIGSTTYTFDPTQVETVRPDIFNSGYFSVFDILVHLYKQGDINLQFHFNESLNTHIIDEIDGETDWWYRIYYSGGWPERNVFRPDHYPWKDQTTLTFYKDNPARIRKIYESWETEVARRNNNNQEIIIPQVVIRSKTFTEIFENVRVTPHNLRQDLFKENTITALDVILSLEKQGKISCELQYYESIGTAGIVKSYWVEAINGDVAIGRCGYVYEVGSTEFQYSLGNHIHLPSDSRVLNSPEYVEYFWICI